MTDRRYSMKLKTFITGQGNYEQRERMQENGMRENPYQLHLMQGGHGKDIQRIAKIKYCIKPNKQFSEDKKQIAN